MVERVREDVEDLGGDGDGVARGVGGFGGAAGGGRERGSVEVLEALRSWGAGARALGLEEMTGVG